MTSTDRRRFLTAAVLGSSAVAGATALGSLAPEAAFAASGRISLAPGVRDPNFAEGRVTGTKGSLILVTGSDRTLHRLHVTNGTSIWKLRPTTFDQINVGDGLYARGVPLGDGTLATDAVWVNIVSLHAEITSIGPARLQLNHHGNKIFGHIIGGTTAAVYNSAPATSDLSPLQVGKHIQVIGAWRPDTNEVDIATIYA